MVQPRQDRRTGVAAAARDVANDTFDLTDAESQLRPTADIGVDYVPSLLERLRLRAQADGVAVTTEVGDAEAVEHPDGTFDAVLCLEAA